MGTTYAWVFSREPSGAQLTNTQGVLGSGRPLLLPIVYQGLLRKTVGPYTEALFQEVCPGSVFSGCLLPPGSTLQPPWTSSGPASMFHGSGRAGTSVLHRQVSSCLNPVGGGDMSWG